MCIYIKKTICVQLFWLNDDGRLVYLRLYRCEIIFITRRAVTWKSYYNNAMVYGGGREKNQIPRRCESAFWTRRDGDGTTWTTRECEKEIANAVRARRGGNLRGLFINVMCVNSSESALLAVVVVVVPKHARDGWRGTGIFVNSFRDRGAAALYTRGVVVVRR